MTSPIKSDKYTYNHPFNECCLEKYICINEYINVYLLLISL